MAVEDQPRLACGRPIDEVWERIGQPPDSHEAICPDCQRARQSLAQLDQATSELRINDETDPELQPRPQMKASIMELARAEVRRGRMLPLRQPEREGAPSELSISEQAVASVVRFAADGVPGLRARRCRVSLQTASAETGTTGPVGVSVVVSVAVSATVVVLETIDELRRRVRAAVTAETGLMVNAIDVTVEDLFDV